MKTWEQLLAELRQDLQDTGDRPRWSDELLYLYSCDAIRDYSLEFPQRIDREALVLSGASYPLPSSYIEEIYVENPIDRYLTRRDPVPGRSYNTLSTPTQYHVESGALYLNGPTLDPVLLTYYGSHSVPTSETDLTFQMTVPDGDVELLRLYVSAKVHAQMRAKQARLDRFEPGSGRRDDNPLLPEVGNLMLEYRQKIAERKGGSVIKLWRSS